MGEQAHKETFSVGRQAGASPSEHRYYVLILFDISSQKKYRLLMKLLKRYGIRIQKSVFEAQLKASQIKKLTASAKRLMSSQRYYDPDDKMRIYKIAGNCEVTVFVAHEGSTVEQNVFF